MQEFASAKIISASPPLLNETSERLSHAENTLRSSLQKTFKSGNESKSIMKKTAGEAAIATARTTKVDFKSEQSAASIKDPQVAVEEPPKKIKLEYPLKEQRVNSRGQSIVYEDYKARMRAIT